jgi:hypothetical protein
LHPRQLLVRRVVPLAAAACGYAVLAVVLTWPLVLNLQTKLPGDPTGDTGVYVWNLWVFTHEILGHGHLPFGTEHIFGFTGGADFSLHNYTPLAGLMGLPLVPWVGVVGAFNAVLMVMLALSGWGLYMLARYSGLRRLTAWTAGALFMAMPLISARETAHLSLVTNAALPLFLWALLRTLDRPTLRGGALVGTLVAVATYSDAYYGIYCVMMGTFVLAWRFLRIDLRGQRPGAARAVRWMDLLLATLLAVAVLPSVFGIRELTIGSLEVRGLVRPYTPMLLAVVVALARAWLTWRPVVRRLPLGVSGVGLLRIGLVSVGVSLLLLSPLLAGIAMRYVAGRLPDTVTFWRSSPRGVDLLAYIVPNPVHVLFGRWTERWLLPDVPDAFPELVASCSIVALAGIAVAARHGVLPAMWQGFAGFFALLSLGPFIHVAGVNTFLIGPWAILRYIPVIGMARSPSRFAIVAAMGLALLFGFALEAWLADRRRWRATGVGLFLLLIALEVVPFTRTLHSAAVPDIYRLVAASGDERGRLLELPTGVRDGTVSVGDFNASSAFFQTQHHRPLIGGYLSRVSDWRRSENVRAPILHALYELSTAPAAGLDPALAAAARASREAFLARSCVRYVVVDKRRASLALRTFASDALGLVPLHEDERYQLLAPASSPVCEVRSVSTLSRLTHLRGIGPR